MNIKLLIVLLAGQLLLAASVAFGQGFCGTNGAFTIIPEAGCAPLKVVVKNQVPRAENIRYAFNFNRKQTTFPDIKQTTEDSSCLYNNAGVYTIFQYGSASGSGFSICKDIVVYETRAPKAELITCPNGLAKLTIIKDSVAKAYDEIEINWGDGSAITLWKEGMALDFFHQFPNNSRPPITIRGLYHAGLCQSSLNTTTLTSTNAPVLDKIKISSVEISSDGKANVLYEGMAGIVSEIFIDKGNGQFVTTGKSGSVGGTQSVNVENLNAGTIFRFKIVSKDICGNPVESAVVSSIIVKEDPSSMDEKIALSWKNLENSGKLIQYQLIRDGKVIFTTADQLSYIDSDVTCGQDYKYEIVAIIENDVRSYSAPITAQPKSLAPETIKKAYVTVESDTQIITRVELSGAGLTNSFDLVVERAISGSKDFTRISDVNNSSLRYDDSDVNASESSYCYRFSYQNACKQISPEFSQPVCSILLKNNVQQIVWTSESPFTGAVASYDMIQVNPETNITEEIPKQLSHSQEIDLDTQSGLSFRIKAYSADGNLTSYSNTLTLTRDAIILIPDAFTPNGDGINEKFEVKNYFTSSFQIKIYNRWGEVIFQSENPGISWDGNIKNAPAAAGEYIFKINTSDRSGKSLVKTGSFLLIR